MTSTNFCYFLQGYLELNNPKTISKEKLTRIKGHLKLAFRDDIDSSMGNKEHQDKLNEIHTFTPGGSVTEYAGSLFNPGERC